jgi:hypothetical protein
MESEWILIDYHPLCEALGLMTARGWGSVLRRGCVGCVLLTGSYKTIPKLLHYLDEVNG